MGETRFCMRCGKEIVNSIYSNPRQCNDCTLKNKREGQKLCTLKLIVRINKKGESK